MSVLLDSTNMLVELCDLVTSSCHSVLFPPGMEWMWTETLQVSVDSMSVMTQSLVSPWIIQFP